MELVRPNTDGKLLVALVAYEYKLLAFGISGLVENDVGVAFGTTDSLHDAVMSDSGFGSCFADYAGNGVGMCMCGTL